MILNFLHTTLDGGQLLAEGVMHRIHIIFERCEQYDL